MVTFRGKLKRRFYEVINMKKIILLAATLAAMLSMTSCTDPSKTEDAVKVEDYINMVRVCSDICEQIFYDNNTGVMYYRYSLSNSNCGITPIYNSDGTLKIYEGWGKHEDN